MAPSDSMLLSVVHETAYDYVPAVKTAQHLAHLRPRDDGGQALLAHELAITPQPAHLTETRDVFGNHRVFFALPGAHDGLRVVATSLVRTRPATSHAPSAPWEAAREAGVYRRGAPWEPAAEFSYASPYVPRHEDLAAYARPSFAPGKPLLEAARDLMACIHADFEYEAEATDVGTPALEALALRKGVCQDFAHVMIGCLRSLGLPARYVSGYLLTEPPAGQPRLVGSDASHAWVAVWLPAHGDEPAAWAELDPTNNRDAGPDYVRLATGRDYGDVSPLRGVIHGGAQHTLSVAVTVTPAEPEALSDQ